MRGLDRGVPCIASLFYAYHKIAVHKIAVWLHCMYVYCICDLKMSRQ